MNDKARKAAGRKGGITKWARIPKSKRSAIMKKVADARWEKKRQLEALQVTPGLTVH